MKLYTRIYAFPKSILQHPHRHFPIQLPFLLPPFSPYTVLFTQFSPLVIRDNRLNSVRPRSGTEWLGVVRNATEWQ